MMNSCGFTVLIVMQVAKLLAASEETLNPSAIERNTYKSADEGASHGNLSSTFHLRRISRIKALNRMVVGTRSYSRHDVLRHYQQNGTQTSEHESSVHAHYHLPLQRLTDVQLAAVLQKLAAKSGEPLLDNELDRFAMINKIQRLIVSQGEGLLMRPKMLLAVPDAPAQLNGSDVMLPDVMTQTRTTVKVSNMESRESSGQDISTQTSPNDTATHESETTEAIDTTPTETDAPLSETVSTTARETTTSIPTTTITTESHSELMQQMMETLRKLKLQYEAVRQEFLRRLHKINERKVQLAGATAALELHSATEIGTPYQPDLAETTTVPLPSTGATVTNETMYLLDEYHSSKGTGLMSGWTWTQRVVARNSSRLETYSASRSDKSSGTEDAQSELSQSSDLVGSTVPDSTTAETTTVSAESTPDVPSSSAVPRANAVPTLVANDDQLRKTAGETADEAKSAITATELVERLQDEMSQNHTVISDGPSDASSEHDVEETLSDTQICSAIACDFESGDLCEWEPSTDELSPASRHYVLRRLLHRSRRMRRDTTDKPYVVRTWHNWQGQYRNRVTGIARAQIFSEGNQRFAAAYVRPQQRATLTGKILSSSEPAIFRFRAWEATRDVQLRVCCDSTENCVYETELGVKRGSRRWKEHTVTCEKGTQKLIFECVNHGQFQGACGIDNVRLVNPVCSATSPPTALHDGGRRLR